jgi:Uma2 family endonuclease
LLFFSIEQINDSHLDGEPIPAFSVEVIATNDQIVAVKAKLDEYFKNGVKVVWLIYPDYELVEAYTSFKTIHVCTGSDICSAAPVLPDFDIPAKQLFF